MRITTVLLLLFASTTVFGQTTPEIYLDNTVRQNLVKNTLDIADETYHYVNDGDSNQLFYYALMPKGKIDGSLVLLSGTAERAEEVINNNTDLFRLAFENGIALIVPSINYNISLDNETINFLNTVFEKAIQTYTLPEEKMILGGFSLGGMTAIRYVQISKENPDVTSIHPIAVLGIDPPLDYVRLYYSFQRTKKLNFSEPAVEEATYSLDRLEYQFGGTPTEVPSAYIQNSMYSRTEKDGGNAKYLVNIPIRLYSDPDIDWHLKERRRDLYDVSVLNQTALINHLRILGNQKAEFINALGKGYRLNGKRHPHSWSIVDPNELMEWIKEVME